MAKKQYGVFYTVLTQSEGEGKNKQNQSINFAWRAPIDTYPKEIATKLGIIAVDKSKSVPGLIFGSNSPRPARVRVNVQKAQGSSSSYLLFANPKKVPGLTVANNLKGVKFKGGTVSSVSLPGTSTNPNRKKKSNTKTSTKSKPKPKPKPRARR